jgi:hypothetical protein
MTPGLAKKLLEIAFPFDKGNCIGAVSVKYEDNAYTIKTYIGTENITSEKLQVDEQLVERIKNEMLASCVINLRLKDTEWRLALGVNEHSIIRPFIIPLSIEKINELNNFYFNAQNDFTISFLMQRY